MTIVGARGFIGSHVVKLAQERGIHTDALSHRDLDDPASTEHSLGTVIYCSGVTSGAETTAASAYRLHVEYPNRILTTCKYDRFVYLSSTRLYDKSPETDERQAILLGPDPEIYRTTKFAGETLAAALDVDARIVRLSNVFGSGMNANVFLADVLHQARTSRTVKLQTTLNSAKDYIGVSDAASLILDIAASSRERVYNVASGYNTSHRELLNALGDPVPLTVEVLEGATTVVNPAIDIARLEREFRRPQENVLSWLREQSRSFVG